MTLDIRDRIFESLAGQTHRATVSVAEAGMLSGMSAALTESKLAGCLPEDLAADGDALVEGQAILRLRGSAKALARAEETVIGALAKSSGVTTATRRLVDSAGSALKIVGGGWKKMPRTLKAMIRDAVHVGGAAPRIDEPPFLYLDKNYVRLFGGVAETLSAVAPLEGHRTVIQIGSGLASLEAETHLAIEGGASTIFVDTGDMADLPVATETLSRSGATRHARLAYGGGIELDQITALAELGVDALCIGRAIVDAPLLDFRMEVEARNRDNNGQVPHGKGEHSDA